MGTELTLCGGPWVRPASLSFCFPVSKEEWERLSYTAHLAEVPLPPKGSALHLSEPSFLFCRMDCCGGQIRS